MHQALVRALTAGAIVAGALFVAAMAYGVIRYPAAPIREVGSTYRDKRGDEYTAEQYHAFRAWETALMVSGLACFALAIPAAILGRAARRQSGTR